MGMIYFSKQYNYYNMFKYVVICLLLSAGVSACNSGDCFIPDSVINEENTRWRCIASNGVETFNLMLYKDGTGCSDGTGRFTYTQEGCGYKLVTDSNLKEVFIYNFKSFHNDQISVLTFGEESDDYPLFEGDKVCQLLEADSAEVTSTCERESL